MNYRRGSCASYFRSLPIDRALSIFYAMKCPDTNGGAAASARSPLYDFDENSKLQRPGKGDIRPFYIEKWQRGHSNRLITSTVLGFEIVIYTYIYIYVYIFSLLFLLPPLVTCTNEIPTRSSSPRSCRENVCENIFSRNDVYGEYMYRERV